MKSNRKRKFISLILVAIMTFGMIPSIAYAEDSTNLGSAINSKETASSEQGSTQAQKEDSSDKEVSSEDETMTISSSPSEAATSEKTSGTESTKASTEASTKKSSKARTAAKSADESVTVSAKEVQEINLIDIDAITATLFEVKPQGGSQFIQAPFPEGTMFHVGDQVHIKFEYTKLTDVTSNNVYYFSIPEGLSAITGDDSRGEIKDGDTVIGSYWVEDGKVKLQFTNEEYLEEGGNEITAGFVNFYARLNQTAVEKDGEITFNDKVLGTLPIEPDADITNVTVDKKNGDGTTDGATLVYDADKNAVQYSFEINTNGNNKTIDKITVVDTLTTTVNNVEDSSIVTGDYKDIQITPSNAATFTKGADGKYVLTANNVAPNQTIKVTYWVPVKEGVVQAKFVNDVEASKTVGGDTTEVGGDSVQGNISNTLQINKTAAKPVFDPDTATTTVTYTVSVKAPENNTTAITNAYVYDEFNINGSFVTDLEKVSGDGTFEALTKGDNANFNVQLGTINPGETKTYTYKVTLDTNQCYFYNAPGNKWFDNHAYAKAGNLTFNNAKASLSFDKQFTDKEGVYDSISGKFRFILTFDGTIPGTDGEYYDSVLKSFNDKITASGATYAGNPAPVLEALKGNTVEKTKTLDGSEIDGKQEFELDIPKDMQGEYSYRLTYYVNMPEGMTQKDKVNNEFTATVGIGPGGTPVTFKSETSVSAATTASNAMNKYAVRGPEIYTVDGTNDYSAIDYKIDITSPIAKNATLTDTVTQDSKAMIDILVPLDFLRESLKLTWNGTTLVENDDYKLEAVGDSDDQFKITFLKAFPGINDTNKLEITYTAKVVSSEYGQGFAENTDGGKIGSLGKITNSATLENNGLTSEKSDTITTGSYIEKKAVDTTGMDDISNDMIVWDVTLSCEDYPAFGRGYHPLVDTLPANQELVKIEYFEDSQNPDSAKRTWCKEGTGEHQYTVVENEDGTSTVSINAFSARRNHSFTYRIYTRIKDSALIAENINPDYFDDVKFTNSAYYEAVGTKWNVAADTTVSRHNNEKTYKYDAETEGKGGVEFTLTINKDGLDMNAKDDTITVEDTMNRALTLKKDTLRINGKTIDQVPGASLVYEEGSNEFKLELPDDTAFTITYIAEIDAEVGETGWLSNEASIEGRYGTVTTESIDEARLDVSAGSSSTLSFYLKKLDTDGNMLSDAKFQLREVTIENGELKETAVNNAAHTDGMFYDFGDGTYKFRGVSKGVIYALEETEAPTGYAKDSEVHYIYFGTPNTAVKEKLEAAGKTVTQCRTGGANKIDSMFKLVNEDATTDIPVEKEWEDGEDASGMRPDSITVNLIETVDNDHKTVKTLTLNDDNDWSDEFSGLPTYKKVVDKETGDITFKEISYSVDEVSVDGYTTSITGDAENGFVITNTRAIPGKHTFTGKKSLKENGVDKAIAAGQFKFLAQASTNNPGTIGGFPTGEISVGADGSFSLGELTFPEAGNYTFTVSEVNGGAAGYTYDSNPVTVTVPVTLDTDSNTLVVGTAKYKKNGAEVDGIKFANTYTAPDGAERTFTGQKSLKENNTDKEILAGQFKFTVEADDSNPADIANLPTGEISVGADGTFSLGTLSFPAAGTYKFTVSEVNGGATGYTYDSNPVTVTVPVTLDAATNTLSVGTVTYEKAGGVVAGIVFKNTYTTPGSAQGQFSGTKTLTENGRAVDIEAGQFKFVAQEDQNNPAAINGFPTDEISVTADGTFSLGTMTFSKAGTYKFTVSEVNGGAAGYVYDDKAVTVTVPVTLDTDTNKLVVGTAKYEKNGAKVDGIKFANTYTSPEGANKVFTGVKKLKENNSDKAITAGQFKFTVEAGANNPSAIGGLPTEEISVLADGTFSLGTLSFTKAGTYTFTVSEVNSGAAGYTYDANPVTVTVPVSLKKTDNTLVIGDVTYEKNGQQVDGIVFDNTYTTPDPIKYGFAGEKTLTENGKDKAIKEGQFNFVIQAGENNPADVELPAKSIPVQEDGTFEIGDLTFTKDGTFTFIISEENGGAAGYSYDDKAVTVTVEVVLNEDDNTLSVDSVTYTKDGKEKSAITFNNVYTTPDPATETVTGTKKLTQNGVAKTITAGQFKFTVSESDDNPAKISGLPTKEISVNANGTFSLGTLSFEKAGEYTFTVSEVNGGEKGYTYDDKPVTVKAIVVLNEQTNKLEVEKMTYEKDGKSSDGIVFNNTYKPETKKHTETSKKPETGDESNTLLWVLLMLMSGAGVTGVHMTSKRRKKSNS